MSHVYYCEADIQFPDHEAATAFADRFSTESDEPLGYEDSPDLTVDAGNVTGNFEANWSIDEELQAAQTLGGRGSISMRCEDCAEATRLTLFTEDVVLAEIEQANYFPGAARIAKNHGLQVPGIDASEVLDRVKDLVTEVENMPPDALSASALQGLKAVEDAL